MESLLQGQEPSLKGLWSSICREARQILISNPELELYISSHILKHFDFASALKFMFVSKLVTKTMTAKVLEAKIDAVLSENLNILEFARADLLAVVDRDPACRRLVQPFLYFKGFQALQCYRLSHQLYISGSVDLAYFVQMRVSEIMTIDIHPGAVIGKGIMIDHGHGIVIGETAVVGDQVSLLHSVTLGGTGKDFGDRHPKIEDGVLLGAGAKVLGNITVGQCSRVASGSVVLSDVPARKTVAGIPASIVGESGCHGDPSAIMDQNFSEN